MSNQNVMYEFQQFGKNAQLIGICMILGLVPGVSFVTGVLTLVFMYLALGNIKNINAQLKDRNLWEFRSKWITSFVLGLFGSFFMMGGLIGFVVTLIYAGWYALYVLIAVVIGIVIMLVGGIMEMQAWENLKNFFEENRNLFPEPINRDVIDGCDKLRTGALMYVLAFLIITLFFGFIFKAIGYFKLAKLNQLGTPYAQPAPTQPQVQPTPQPAAAPSTSKFCASCGAKLKREEQFCGVCGAKVE
jgi:uncharacterized membrane protein